MQPFEVLADRIRVVSIWHCINLGSETTPTILMILITEKIFIHTHGCVLESTFLFQVVTVPMRKPGASAQLQSGPLPGITKKSREVPEGNLNNGALI